MVRETSSQFVNQIVSNIFDLFFNRSQREKLGRHLISQARAEGNDNPETNGEYWLLRQVAQILKEQSAITIFDVGANEGYWRKKTTSIFSARACINSFEPSKATFNILRKNLGETAKDNVRDTWNFGLGREDAIIPLYVTREGAGTNSVYARRDLSHFASVKEEIQIRRGDNFCEEQGIRQIDFLKIDTEGHEMDVLFGLEKMLAQQQVRFIQFEYGGCWTDARNFIYDAFDYLGSKGYVLGKLFPSQIEFHPEYEMELDNFRYANYVAMLPADAEMLGNLKDKGD